jgi:type IV pilus assembly protein PilC
MPLYKYTAKNQHAETVKGKVEARNLSQAAAALRGRNLLVIKLDAESGSMFAQLSGVLSGIKEDEIVALTRQLSTMVTAGLSLTQALNILQQQAKPAVATMMDKLLQDIEGGSTFAKALEKHPKQFSRVFIQLVRAGETAGVLDKVLQRLAENMEKNKEFKAKTKGALIYPIIVVIAMLVVAGIMMVFVVPKLTEMYQDFGADLPVVTQILIDTSEFFQNFWWLILGVIAVAGVGIQRWYKTPTGERKISGWLLKIPLYGELRKKVILTEFSRTLALLLAAGISLLEALEVSSDAINMVLYRDALEDSYKRVEKGINLAKTLNNTDLFPPILTQMVSVGEETGKLDEVLLKISNYFQSESEQAIKNLTTALEPMIMLVLGLGVGFMVFAIVMPIYTLTSQF